MHRNPLSFSGPLRLSGIIICNQKGVSIVAVVATMLILSVMGVTLISLVTTGSDISINQLQSEKAFNIAQGGVEFESRSLATNLDWYTSPTDPIAPTTKTLGDGPFTVATNLPATMLSKKLKAADTTAFVYTTDRFPGSGFLQVDNEFIQYGGTTVTSFTGLSRGFTIGAVASVAADHQRGSSVYPVSTLLQAGGLPADCVSATFTITSNSKLLSAGTLNIEGEEISYGGSSASGGTTTLRGVQRCLGTITNMAHASSVPVTPIRVGGDTASYQAEIVSTGSVGTSAVRVGRKTIQR